MSLSIRQRERVHGKKMKHDYVRDCGNAAGDSVLYELHQRTGFPSHELIDNIQILKFPTCGYDEISSSHKKV